MSEISAWTVACIIHIPVLLEELNCVQKFLHHGWNSMRLFEYLTPRIQFGNGNGNGYCSHQLELNFKIKNSLSFAYLAILMQLPAQHSCKVSGCYESWHQAVCWDSLCMEKSVLNSECQKLGRWMLRMKLLEWLQGEWLPLPPAHCNSPWVIWKILTVT